MDMTPNVIDPSQGNGNDILVSIWQSCSQKKCQSKNKNGAILSFQIRNVPFFQDQGNQGIPRRHTMSMSHNPAQGGTSIDLPQAD
jgi:hypothetical protein